MNDKLKSILPLKKISGEYNCGENNTLYLICNFTKNEYFSLVSDIRAIGYQELQSSSLDNFDSITFSTDFGSLILNFDSIVSELRIIEDSSSAILNTEISIENNNPVVLWQYEIDHSLIDCGMCYIFRCSDYSFFIIDSAHTYSLNDDIRIYEFLRKETPDGLPVTISGWFFSHGHVDHIAKFLDILKYNNDIIIKGLYFNFVPVDHPSSYAWMQSDINHTIQFLDEVYNNHSIPVYKLHSGQYFYIDKLRLDVLCTHEDVYPGDLENYNDSSTMLMVTVGEDKICFPGDAGGAESDIVERRFPKFLKCNIMQVSHHGHFGTSSEFYKMAGAETALFATTQIKFDEEYPHYEANRVACNLARHIFIASNGTVKFTFPLKDSEILIYPDEIIEDFNGIYNLWGYDYSEDFKTNLIKKHKESQNYSKNPY